MARTPRTRDYSRLLAQLGEEYRRRSPASASLQERALRHLVDGGSHNLRLLSPFPPRIASARGARVTDEDGHSILDFWQGHHANILGHNPAPVTEALARFFAGGSGLQTGFVDRLQVEVAELLCRQTGMERARFTTSGSLATMYAVLLARAATGRELVMKIGGGWHGAQPWGLKGVEYHNGGRAEGRMVDIHFQQMDTRGLPEAIDQEVVVTRFNDGDMLRSQFRAHGEQIACFILEPFVGAGGCIPAETEYLREARELADRYGSLLIFDEVIAGFRFHPGLAGRLYGVQPDLATLAKILGGGMPVAAVVGRGEIMELAGRSGSVRFSGGTYSGHPACLVAARTMLEHLAGHQSEIYPRINEMGARARQAVEGAFASEGILARCTGAGGALPGSSVSAVIFPYSEEHCCRSPEDTHNPHLCDAELSDRVLQLALLLEDVYVVHGLGSISAAHSEADVEYLAQACGRAARRIKPYL
jgi:glutamate-1-semialdehyde 2,1-aminomutase